MAQKGKGGGGAGAGGAGAPPGSSGPASASGTQQTGYVYRLPWRYHIQYESVKSREADSLVHNGKPTANFNTYTKRVLYKHLAQGVRETVEIHQDHDKVKRGIVKDSDLVYPAAPLPNLDGQLVTYVTIDSVNRYWDRPRLGIVHWYLPWNWFRYLFKFPDWFTQYRMRVSVTQADSGKLQLGIYERAFTTSQHPYDDKFIDATNIIRGQVKTPDYAIPIGDKDSAQNFYLQIDKKVFTADPISYLSLRYSLTQFGAMIIPYKYRFAPKDTKIFVAKPQSTRYNADTVVSAPSESTGNINLAVFVGRKWGYTRFYSDQTKTHNTVAVMLSGFAGASLVPLSVSNVKYPNDADSLPAQAIAFSVGGAASVEWRIIDLGLFAGWDITSDKYNWIYNKKLWVGFGIGVNLGMFTSGPAQFQQ